MKTYTQFIGEGSLNEGNTQLSKKVKKELDDRFGSVKQGSPDHQLGTMVIMMGALKSLSDKNFSRKASSLNKFFPKANQSKHSSNDAMASFMMDVGKDLARLAKNDGNDIIDAFADYTSKTMGRQMGQKLQSLKEGVVNEADVVGKTLFSDDRGKLFFGYFKTDDGVEFVDYKTWKKLPFKDVSKSDTDKERVISAILRKQKQFNKKVDYNMWAKKTNPSFEEKMDYLIKNGFISNITKRGIKVNESVESVVNEGEKLPKVDVQKVLKQKGYEPIFTSIDNVKRELKRLGYSRDEIQDTLIHHFYDKDPKILKKIKEEVVNEAASRTAMEIGGLTGMNKNAIQTFVDSNELDIEKVFQFVKKGNLEDRRDLVTAIAGKPNNPIQKKIIKMFKESVVNEALVSKDKKAVDAFFDKKDFEGKNVNSDGKTLSTAGLGAQDMFTHTSQGVKMVGKVTGRYDQSLVQYVNKNYKSDLVESVVSEL